MRNITDWQEEVRRNYRHNFIVNFLDGSFFWFAYSFIAPGVILPLFVSHFSDSKFLIGMIAAISATGWFFPQLFTANWIESLPVKKVAPVKVGFFTERLPLLFLPFSALLTITQPVLALSLFFILFAWHALGAGVVAVGWQDMIAKVIPVERRGLFMGITTFAGNAMGILGAVLAARLLDLYTFPYGYVIIFAIAAVLIFCSWFFLSLTREPAVENPSSSATAREYWQRLPTILLEDTNLRWYLLGQLLLGLGGMVWGFLAVYAVEEWGLSDGQVGFYNTSLMIGQALGNIFLGLVGDRKGYKLVILVSIVAAALSILVALLTTDPVWMNLVFGLRGISLGGGFLASMIVLEFSKPEIRPTYIGVNNTLIGIVSIVAPIIGGWIAQGAGYKPLFFVAMIFTVISFGVISGFVREPRHRVLTQEETQNVG